MKLKGHIAMLGADAVWGLMAPIAKMVLAAGLITPVMMADFRIAGAAILFWITSFFVPKEHVPPKDLLLLAGAGMIGIVLNQGGYIFGVALTSPGEAAIVTTTMPMWVMLLAAVFLRERPRGGALLGLVLGASGALILISGTLGATANKGDNPMLGDLLVFGAQLSYASYLTLYKNFIKKYSVVTLMKWMFTFATLAVTPFAIPAYLSTQWSTITWPMWAGAAYVVVLGTFVAYICIMIGQKLLTPAVVGMYNYVQPIVACMVGVYLGLDRFTPLKILAVALIFTGVYLVTIYRSLPNKEGMLPKDGKVLCFTKRLRR